MNRHVIRPDKLLWPFLRHALITLCFGHKLETVTNENGISIFRVYTRSQKNTDWTIDDAEVFLSYRAMKKKNVQAISDMSKSDQTKFITTARRGFLCAIPKCACGRFKKNIRKLSEKEFLQYSKKISFDKDYQYFLYEGKDLPEICEKKPSPPSPPALPVGTTIVYIVLTEPLIMSEGPDSSAATSRALNEEQSIQPIDMSWDVSIPTQSPNMPLETNTNSMADSGTETMMSPPSPSAHGPWYTDHASVTQEENELNSPFSPYSNNSSGYESIEEDKEVNVGLQPILIMKDEDAISKQITISESGPQNEIRWSEIDHFLISKLHSEEVQEEEDPERSFIGGHSNSEKAELKEKLKVDLTNGKLPFVTENMDVSIGQRSDESKPQHGLLQNNFFNGENKNFNFPVNLNSEESGNESILKTESPDSKLSHDQSDIFEYFSSTATFENVDPDNFDAYLDDLDDFFAERISDRTDDDIQAIRDDLKD